MNAETHDRDKAIAVARDVLAHLDTLNVNRGTYYRGSVPGVHNMTGDLQDHLPAFQANCRVCLLGACFLSHVRLFNDFPISRVLKYTHWGVSVEIPGNRMRSELEQTFGMANLARMEAAFEMWLCEGKDTALRFGACYFDDRERVRAVMENIIANNGDFIP